MEERCDKETEWWKGGEKKRRKEEEEEKKRGGERGGRGGGGEGSKDVWFWEGENETKKEEEEKKRREREKISIEEHGRKLKKKWINKQRKHETTTLEKLNKQNKECKKKNHWKVHKNNIYKREKNKK